MGQSATNPRLTQHGTQILNRQNIFESTWLMWDQRKYKLTSPGSHNLLRDLSERRGFHIQSNHYDFLFLSSFNLKKDQTKHLLLPL